MCFRFTQLEGEKQCSKGWSTWQAVGNQVLVPCSVCHRYYLEKKEENIPKPL